MPGRPLVIVVAMLNDKDIRCLIRPFRRGQWGGWGGSREADFGPVPRQHQAAACLSEVCNGGVGAVAAVILLSVATVGFSSPALLLLDSGRGEEMWWAPLLLHVESNRLRMQVVAWILLVLQGFVLGGEVQGWIDAGGRGGAARETLVESSEKACGRGSGSGQETSARDKRSE